MKHSAYLTSRPPVPIDSKSSPFKPVPRSPILISEAGGQPIDSYELRNLRELRLQALQDTIRGVYQQILDDELLGAMKEESSSKDFMAQRVKEIFEEVIESEREMYIDKLLSQYNYMKTMYKQLEDELRKTSKDLESLRDDNLGKADALSTEKKDLQRSNEALEEENKRLQAKLQSFSQNFNDSMKKKDQDLHRSLEAKLEYETRIEQLQKQLKSQSLQLKTLEGENDSERGRMKELQHDNEIMRAKLGVLEETNKKLQGITEELSEKEGSFKGRIQSLNEENRELSRKMDLLEKECQAKILKIEEATKFNEESFQEFLESKKLKSKQKLENYKSKLVEYKQVNASLQNTIEDLERALTQEKGRSAELEEQLRAQFAQKEEQMKEKVREVEEFYQEKLSEEKAQIEAQIKSFQTELRTNFESKRTKQKAKKKALISKYESQIRELEKGSIDRKTFEEFSSKKDKIIEDLTNKLISYDRDQEVKLQKNIEVIEARRAAEYDAKLKAYYQNVDAVEASLAEERRKLQLSEAEIADYKVRFKEIQAKTEELSHYLSEKQQEVTQLTDELKDLEGLKEKLESELEERQVIFARNQENSDRLTNENAFLNKSLEDKESLLKNQYREIEKLQKSLSAQMEKSEKSQAELFASQRNFAEFENSAKENARLLKQSLEMITTENQALSQRIAQVQKETQEKVEEERKNASNLKKENYVADLKLSEKDEKIQFLSKALEKQEEAVRDLENRLKSSQQAVMRSESRISAKENEKAKALNQIKLLKKRFIGILREKFSDVRANLRRLKANCESVVEEYQGLIKQHISSIPKEIQLFKRNLANSELEQRERMRMDFEDRHQLEVSGLQEKSVIYEQELKKKFENQFEDWNRKSAELTRKMDEIQGNSKKLQGEIYSLLKEKEAYSKEIDLLKGELEKALTLNQTLSREKSDLTQNQERILSEFKFKIEEKTKKNERKYIKTLKKLKKDIESLQNGNLRNLTEINQGVEALQERYAIEVKGISKSFNEKTQGLREKISDFEEDISHYQEKCRNYETLINNLENSISELSEEKSLVVSRYENTLFAMNQTLDELSTQSRIDKERFSRDSSEKNNEIENLKNKLSRTETDVRRKEEEIYSLRREQNKIAQQYDEAMIKYNLKHNHFEKENLEQAQEKRKYAEDLENLQNLITKKYHKMNQSERADRKQVNLDEKVKKLHDLEEELKSSMRTKTVVSPERQSGLAKVSTPMIKGNGDLNKQYYSNLTMKKTINSAGTKK